MATTRYYRTQTAGAGDSRKKSTFSCWIKRYGNLTSYQHLFTNTPNPGDWDSVRITDGSQFELTMNNDVYVVRTEAVLRDVSAWYHLVVNVDTTQATASNRVKLYINGVLQTSLSLSSYPTLNFESNFGDAGKTFQIGAQTWSNNEYLDGSMANVIFCDGFTYDASFFGQTDATTGIWKPKDFSGSYGTNGFFLNFSNSASLALDSSGNGNNFTISGTPTQTVDTPSNVFCAINPLDPAPSQTFSNGNLTSSYSVNNKTNRSSFAFDTGKWYWEMKVSSASGNGILTGITDSTQLLSTWVGDGTYSYGYYNSNGQKYNVATGAAYGNSYTTNDIISIAFDATNGKLYFGKNGTWQNSGNPATDTNPAFTGLTGRLFFPATSGYNGDVINYNFGNGYFATTAITSPVSDGAGLGKFQYAVPSGYYALCTKNINVYG
jgi:hypothetical protein